MPAVGTLVVLHYFDAVSGGVLTPVVYNMVPASVAQGVTGVTVEVNGLNFGNTGGTPAVVLSPGTGITINSTTFVSSGQLQLNVTVAAGAPLGAQDVTVTNPAGDGGLSGFLAGALTVVAPSTGGGGGGGPQNEYWTGIVFPWQATPAILVRVVSNADHLTGINGVALTLRISKNAGAFVTPSPPLTITDTGANGFYKITSEGANANFDTPGEWILEVTAPGTDTRWWYFSVAQVAVAYSPT